MQVGLFLIFVAVPLIEIAILIKVGQWIGFFPTLLIVVLTAIAGTYVLHSQGLQVARRAMDSLSKGQPPIAPIIDGSFLMVAGALLLTPGLLTDFAGIALLIKPVRSFVSRWVVRKVIGVAVFQSGTSGRQSKRRRQTNDRPGFAEPGVHDQAGGNTTAHNERDAQPSRSDQNAKGPIIEGEFERLDERTIDPKRKRGSET
jgi:UPF0716 protein FxsA